MLRHPVLAMSVVVTCMLSSVALADEAPKAKLKLKITPGATTSQDVSQHDDKVSIDFPEPTDIRDIAHAAALWTGKPVIMDRNVNGKIVIASPERVTVDQAWARFLTALDNLGLVAAEHHGVTVIMPKRSQTPDREAQREAMTLPAMAPMAGQVKMDYAEPTEIVKIIRDVADWTGRRIVVDRNINGKIQIINAEPVSRELGSYIYLYALDTLGLSEVERDGVIQIVPIFSAAKARARSLDLSLLPSTAKEPKDKISFPSEPTDITKILDQAKNWCGAPLIYGRDVSGKVQIFNKDSLDRDDANKVLIAALDILGLTVKQTGDSITVLPYRLANKP